MIAKHIKVHVKPGHMDGYLAAQETWNRETQNIPGYLGQFCGIAPGDPDVVHVQLYWRSNQHLSDFMANHHDRIAKLANAEEHYERIEVSILTPVLPPTITPVV